MARIGLKSEPIVLSAQTADLLIGRGSGDAALLYLYLLRTGGEYDSAKAQTALGWNAAQAMSAFRHLVELGLAEDHTPAERAQAPKAEDCPNYTTEDITAELRSEGSEFRPLLEEVEHLLGKKCSVTETRILLELYDHLAMPPEVLLLICAHQIEVTERKYGPGRKPRMSEIKTAAYRWKKNGVDTVEQADSYLKKLSYYASREGELLQALNIHSREALDGEKRYLRQWIEWGFDAEAVRIAYERTLMKKGDFSWPYCNGILRGWNNDGVHTAQEINARSRGGNRRPPTHSGQPAQQSAAPESVRTNLEWMRRVLEEEETEN